MDDKLLEKIVHLDNGKWQVQSEKGKNLGTYDTKAEAEKRLQQVHYFKHMNESVTKDTFIFDGKEAWCGAVNTLDGTIEEVHSYKEAKENDFHHSLYFSEAQLDKMDKGESCFFCVYPDKSIMVDAVGRFNPEDKEITFDKKFLEDNIISQIKFIVKEDLDLDVLPVPDYKNNRDVHINYGCPGDPEEVIIEHLEEKVWALEVETTKTSMVIGDGWKNDLPEVFNGWFTFAEGYQKLLEYKISYNNPVTVHLCCEYTTRTGYLGIFSILFRYIDKVNEDLDIDAADSDELYIINQGADSEALLIKRPELLLSTMDDSTVQYIRRECGLPRLLRVNSDGKSYLLGGGDETSLHGFVQVRPSGFEDNLKEFLSPEDWKKFTSHPAWIKSKEDTEEYVYKLFHEDLEVDGAELDISWLNFIDKHNPLTEEEISNIILKYGDIKRWWFEYSQIKYLENSFCWYGSDDEIIGELSYLNGYFTFDEAFKLFKKAEIRPGEELSLRFFASHQDTDLADFGSEAWGDGDYEILFKKEEFKLKEDIEIDSAPVSAIASKKSFRVGFTRYKIIDTELKKKIIKEIPIDHVQDVYTATLDDDWYLNVWNYSNDQGYINVYRDGTRILGMSDDGFRPSKELVQEVVFNGVITEDIDLDITDTSSLIAPSAEVYGIKSYIIDKKEIRKAIADIIGNKSLLNYLNKEYTWRFYRFNISSRLSIDLGGKLVYAVPELTNTEAYEIINKYLLEDLEIDNSGADMSWTKYIFGSRLSDSNTDLIIELILDNMDKKVWNFTYFSKADDHVYMGYVNRMPEEFRYLNGYFTFNDAFKMFKEADIGSNKLFLNLGSPAPGSGIHHPAILRRDGGEEVKEDLDFDSTNINDSGEVVVVDGYSYYRLSPAQAEEFVPVYLEFLKNDERNLSVDIDIVQAALHDGIDAVEICRDKVHSDVIWVDVYNSADYSEVGILEDDFIKHFVPLINMDKIPVFKHIEEEKVEESYDDILDENLSIHEDLEWDSIEVDSFLDPYIVEINSNTELVDILNKDGGYYNVWILPNGLCGYVKQGDEEEVTKFVNDMGKDREYLREFLNGKCVRIAKLYSIAAPSFSQVAVVPPENLTSQQLKTITAFKDILYSCDVKIRVRGRYKSYSGNFEEYLRHNNYITEDIDIQELSGKPTEKVEDKNGSIVDGAFILGDEIKQKIIDDIFSGRCQLVNIIRNTYTEDAPDLAHIADMLSDYYNELWIRISPVADAYGDIRGSIIVAVPSSSDLRRIILKSTGELEDMLEYSGYKIRSLSSNIDSSNGINSVPSDTGPSNTGI